MLADHEPTAGTGGSADPRSLVGMSVPVSRAGTLEPEGAPGAGGTAVAEDGWGSMRSFGSPGWGTERLGSRGVTSDAPRPGTGTGTDIGAIGGVPPAALSPSTRRSPADRRRSLLVTRSSRAIGSGALHGGDSTAAGDSMLLGTRARARLRGRRNSVSGVGGAFMHGNRPESGRLLRREADVDMATVADVRIRMAFAAIAGEASSDGNVRDGVSGGANRMPTGRGDVGPGVGSLEEEGGGWDVGAAAAAWGFPFGLPAPNGDAMSQSSNTLFYE